MWPSIVTIDQFLSKDDIDTVMERVDTGRFHDGGVSAGGGNLLVKNNLEMAPQQQYVEVVKLVERAIRENVELNYAVFPRTITKAIINRYDEGMSYGVHIDSPVIGFMVQKQALGPFGQNYVRSDFSMTVFLSDPDTYDGGELTFDSPWGAHRYKLPKGSAVVYPTGIPHQVTPVTRGSRIAAILWMQSMIRDHEQRRLVSEINRLARMLFIADPDAPEAKLAQDIASTALRINADV